VRKFLVAMNGAVLGCPAWCPRWHPVRNAMDFHRPSRSDHGRAEAEKCDPPDPNIQYPILTPLECGFALYLFERCTPTAAPISGGAEQCPSRALIRALMLRYVAKRSAGSGLAKVRN
jgi:hypothetical protein